MYTYVVFALLTLAQCAASLSCEDAKEHYTHFKCGTDNAHLQHCATTLETMQRYHECTAWGGWYVHLADSASAVVDRVVTPVLNTTTSATDKVYAMVHLGLIAVIVASASLALCYVLPRNVHASHIKQKNEVERDTSEHIFDDRGHHVTPERLTARDPAPSAARKQGAKSGITITGNVTGGGSGSIFGHVYNYTDRKAPVFQTRDSLDSQ